MTSNDHERRGGKVLNENGRGLFYRILKIRGNMEIKIHALLTLSDDN
jgi:hypothetical protein